MKYRVKILAHKLLPVHLSALVLGLFTLLLLVLSSVTQSSSVKPPSNQPDVQLVVLGIAQDAGYPQISCYKPHCMPAWRDPSKQRLATSLAVIEYQNKTKYLFEATPDIKPQLFRLHQLAPDNNYSLDGCILDSCTYGTLHRINAFWP